MICLRDIAAHAGTCGLPLNISSKMCGLRKPRSVICSECTAPGRGRVGAAAQQWASEGNLWIGCGRVSGRHRRFPWANAASELAMQGEGSTQARWHLFIDSPKGRPKEQWLSLQYLPQCHKTQSFLVCLVPPKLLTVCWSPEGVSASEQVCA